METVKDFFDYEIINASRGEKLERWGNVFLLRPDPQVIWDNGIISDNYHHINAIYHRSNKGGGYWENLISTPEAWQIKYKNLLFNVRQMGFKHTGVFPEQAVNWDYMINKISSANREVKVLNLFAYTGCASVACLSAGASVTHVDASKGMNEWAKENVKSSGLADKSIRFITDDVKKFVEREIRRGNKYDAIIMDPPSYGRGANNEIWNIETDLFQLVELCVSLLVDKPLFFIINSYTSGLPKSVMENVMKLTVLKRFDGFLTSDEIGINIESDNLVLPCGNYVRFESER